MLIEKIKQYQQVIEATLAEKLQSLDLIEPLKSAISYAVFPAGKRVRPLLSTLLAGELGANPVEYIDAAVSLELLHCSSLIHDDLPGMDNDDMRRGRPSCHKAFDEATAILAGDFLVSYAAKLVLQASFSSDLNIRMTDELMNAYCELCAGQQMDIIDGEQRPALYEIHKRKTGALFGAVFSMAVAAAGQKSSVMNRARTVGVQLGVCFQLLDDYMDVYGTDEDRGRSGSSDQRKGKQTFFSGMPLERAREEWEHARKELDRGLDQFELELQEVPLTRAYINQILSRFEIK